MPEVGWALCCHIRNRKFKKKIKLRNMIMSSVSES